MYSINFNPRRLLTYPTAVKINPRVSISSILTVKLNIGYTINCMIQPRMYPIVVSIADLAGGVNFFVISNRDR